MKEVFRELIKKWSNETFGKAIEQFPDKHKDVEKVLKELKDKKKKMLYEKKVNGYCVEGLEVHPKATNRLPNWCNFSSMFYNLADDHVPHPVEFISEICGGYENYLATRPDWVVPAWGLVPRALKTLASFYREIDFRDSIKQELSSRGIACEVSLPDPDVDTKDHTDVIVVIDKIEYRIWLFQISEAGVFHTSDRVAGNRGKLLDGIHILCGHDRDQPGHEESIEGWNLFSDDRVKESLSKIMSVHNGEISPKQYTEVKNILEGPKNLLSNMTAFKV